MFACSRENVGTILASLGVAFRFLTLAGQADAQTLGGIYEVPPIFLFALLAKGTCRGQPGGCYQSYF